MKALVSSVNSFKLQKKEVRRDREIGLEDGSYLVENHFVERY